MSLLKRLPLRFSLRTLCILPVILALFLGWIAWPADTAGAFVALINAEKWEEASAMLGPKVDRARLTELQRQFTHPKRNQTEQWHVDSESRTWADMAAGYQHFRIRETCYHFFVKRGQVVHIQDVPCFGGIEFWR